MLGKKIYRATLLLSYCFLLVPDPGHAGTGSGDYPGHGIFFKSDQGAALGILMDQRMSNLHYEGWGAVVNIGRYAHRPSFISELSARARYNYQRPAHRSTIVENPAGGIRYLHLWKVKPGENIDLYAGGQADVFANFKIATGLGNSFLNADMVAAIRPQGEARFGSRFFWRDWNVELSMAASIVGYTMRIPEYGVSFELDEEGGVRIQGYESFFLTPLNYAHITTGIFIRESFWGSANPNWFRVGYIWDYYSLAGKHDLNASNALHQFVLELYFKVR